MGKSSKNSNKLSSVTSAKAFITPRKEVTSMLEKVTKWQPSSPWVKKKEKRCEEHDSCNTEKVGELMVTYLCYCHFCNQCDMFIIHRPYVL